MRPDIGEKAIMYGANPYRTNHERRFTMRKGIYNGRTYTFTNWNPKTNEVWAEDFPTGRTSLGLTIYGKWIHRDKVKFL